MNVYTSVKGHSSSIKSVSSSRCQRHPQIEDNSRNNHAISTRRFYYQFQTYTDNASTFYRNQSPVTRNARKMPCAIQYNRTTIHISKWRWEDCLFYIPEGEETHIIKVLVKSSTTKIHFIGTNMMQNLKWDSFISSQQPQLYFRLSLIHISEPTRPY